MAPADVCAASRRTAWLLMVTSSETRGNRLHDRAAEPVTGPPIGVVCVVTAA